jgi:PAS domain S-box-containing protein
MSDHSASPPAPSTPEDLSRGVALISSEGKWISLNQGVCAITGYTQDELEKLTFQDITHPDDLDADLLYVKQVLNRKIETYSMEKRYIRKDRSIVWVLLTVSAAWDACGDFRYFISEIEDITERKKHGKPGPRANTAL